ncbi:DUF1643 domain-containing protein (plasmid) [Escherichia coli]|nr:DUF1643 domain-containing protein [Escherichia coli]
MHIVCQKLGLTVAYTWPTCRIRSHQRHEMMKASDTIGKDNDSHLIRLVSGAGLVVAAWGNEGRHLKRSTTVRQLLPESTMCFVLNATGEAEAPLYMKTTVFSYL